MTAIEFLSHLWPQNGSYYVLVRIDRSGKPRQHFLTRDDFARIASIQEQAFRAQENVYMALFSFADKKRKQEHAEYCRCLFLDLDVGASTPEKPKYPSQVAALQALQKFCATTQLPPPSMLVNSGAGVHVYWTLTESLPLVEWQLLADDLFQKAVQHRFLIDTAVTRDSARILRLPGSQNWKYSSPLPVTVLHRGTDYPVQRFRQLSSAEIPASYAPQPSADLTLTTQLAQLGTKPKYFKTLLTRCAQGTGCAQLITSIKHRTEESEPLWRAALSIAKFCIDSQQAIHGISQGHPGYDAAATERKADLIIGPYKCQSFNDLRPGICEQCPHWNRLTSPIQLGDTVDTHPEPQTATPADRETVVIGQQAVGYILKNEPIPSSTTPTPFPYVISTVGETYRLLSDIEVAELTKEKITVDYLDSKAVIKEYPGHIKLLGRGYDDETGDETVQLATKIGRQNYRFANVPAKEIAGRETLRRALGGAAILDEKDNQFVRTFIKQLVREDARHRDAIPISRQLGWTDNLDAFVLGRHAIQKDGSVSNVIPSSNLDSLLSSAQVKGSAQHWMRMADYWNREEHYGMAFTLLSTFGAPLMPLLNMGVAGALIHLFSPESGIGKSAVQAMVAAAYGNPKMLFFTPQDTVNATLNRVGVYHTLPVCMDEVTNHSPEAVSQLVYQVTQGREKLRMNSDAKIRNASGHWCTTVVTSGNASLMDKLFSIKSAPEGELMRFVEIRPSLQLQGITSLSEVMDGIDSNYGSVGTLYAYYLVTQRPHVVGLLARVRARLRAASVLGEAQRYWLALLTANIAGGLLAKDLGFIQYDMGAIEAWAVDFVTQHQRSITTRRLLPENVFHDIIAKYSQSVVIAAKTGIPQIPRNPPMLRLNLATQELAVSLSALTQEAQKLQVALADLTQHLRCDTYQYSHSVVVNLTEGLPPNLFTPLPVRCAVYKVDTTLIDTTLLTDTQNVVAFGGRK